MNSLRLQLILVVGTLLSLPALAQVKSDYDKTADFTKYKTYSFAGWQKGSEQQINDLDKKRIYDAFKSEFELRGMKYQETGADATITLYLVLQNKTSTTAYTNYNTGFGYYPPRWGWGMGYATPMGMGTATTTYTENDYVEGTMVVDMYDNGSKTLVWQGVLTKVVKEDPKKREKSIPKSISKLMKPFPVQPVK